MVDEARAKGAQVVVVLSHNGMDVDLKMASRVQRHRRHHGWPHP
jgi:sulfur-oxidizing protein SoxB